MTYEPLFPYELVEILNGVLGVSLLWMLVFIIVHLHRSWLHVRKSYGGRGGLLRSLRRMYADFKPEIALLTIVGAFCVRTFVLWYVRWLKNNDIVWNDVVTDNSGEILVVLTGVLILGVICWIRVISPFSRRGAVYLWFIMAFSSVAFGVGMHYAF